MDDVLTFEFTVDCSAEHAFDVWARRTSLWWPRDHSRSRDPELVVTIEGRPNGRIYERTADGEEHDWGEVIDWDPPRRLSYLWHIYGEREEATRVEITFVPTGSSTTVRIVHTGWARLGDRGAELRRRNRAGWEGLASHFTAFVEGAAS